MPLLGLSAPREDIDGLFDSFDLDTSGDITFREFNKLLRRDSKHGSRKRVVAIAEEEVEIADPRAIRHELRRSLITLADSVNETLKERAKQAPTVERHSSSGSLILEEDDEDDED